MSVSGLAKQRMISSTDFPKTHDLVILLRLATGASQLAIDSTVVQPLNRYVVEARYPGQWDPITRIEAEESVELAKRLRAAVRAILPGEALENSE